MSEDLKEINIAVIIPAYNEELTIEGVIKDFFQHCPQASIYVVDNNSSDRTAELALKTYEILGCKGGLISEKQPGKAAAVRKAFRMVESDIFVMADADLTYPAADLESLLKPVMNGDADMVCGNRHSCNRYASENKRPMHNLGNKLVRKLINVLFHGNLEDILTGYRVFSARFVKNYPILSNGFELETEMSIHALDKGYSILEIPTRYQDRPEGSFSKLNTIKDGVRVIKTIFSVFVQYRPLFFFSCCSIFFGVLGIIVGAVPVIEFIHTSYVTHLPLAVLACGLEILAMLSFCVACIMHGLNASQRFSHALMLLHWDETHKHLGFKSR